MSTILNLEIDQGVSKNILITWLDGSTNLPMDLTGYTADLQVKQFYGSPDVLLELSTANNKISLDAGPGTIVLIFTPADTQNMTVYEGVYELVMTRPDNSKVSFVRGLFTLTQSITI